MADNPGEHQRTLFSYLSTVYVHNVLSKKPSVKGLSEKNVEAFLKIGFAPKGKRKFLIEDQKRAFLLSFLSEEDRSLLLPLWAFVFQELEEELGALVKVDRRYISVLVFEEYSLRES